MKENKTFDTIIGAMLFIVVGIMPLIVRATFRPVPPESLDLLHGVTNGQNIYINIFSYWRGWFLGLPASVIAFYCVSEAVTSGLRDFNIKKIIKDPVIIASGVFLLFVLLSAIFSDYTHTAWHGTYDRGEGVWIWLAYFTVFFGTIYYVKKPIHAKVILWGLIFSSIIMGLIGLSQFIERDFFGTALGEWLVAGGIAQYIDEFTIRFDFSFGTQYNPNTFGLYTAMLTPILFITAITYDGKKIINALLFIAGGLMLTGIFGSRSLGGFIGIAAAAGLIITVFIGMFIYRMRTASDRRKPRKSDIVLWLAGAAALAAIAASMIFITPINDRLTVLRNRFNVMLWAQPQPVYDFFFQGNTMTVHFDDAPLFSATIETNLLTDADTPRFVRTEWLTVRDANANIIPFADRVPFEGGADYHFDIPNYRRVTITFLENHFIYKNMMFTTTNDTLFGVAYSGNLFDISQPVPAFGFRGREQWGSSRGYIFSRSFPLLPRRWLIGSGPDTYINVFPNHDMPGKLQHLTSPYQIVDKAHNLYLQTWITTGGISALALIFLFGHYLITTFLSLIRTTKEKPRFTYGLQLGLLAGIGAFCVASMSTDSTIGSTGVFFVLLGLGYGVNYLSSRPATYG
ncbi:MAG: O-antigen ligase family protein [Defluviitaleaceae bacterium]|nr:O-antigen ligase family protein [Defluviitaleaceae bacterium]